MTKRVTKKYIMENYNVLQVGYCQLQTLLKYETPKYYTAGVYGWNADIYIFDDIALVTGYRPFGKKAVSVQHFENKAFEFFKRGGSPETIKKEIKQTIERFLYTNANKVLGVKYTQKNYFRAEPDIRTMKKHFFN